MVRESLSRTNQTLMLYITAYVSIKRLHAFLREEEVPEWASSLVRNKPGARGCKEIGFRNAVLRWSNRDLFQLGPLNVSFPLGKLSLVTGSTGSGKSAFLGALLGGTISYENQLYPWLLINRRAVRPRGRSFDQQKGKRGCVLRSESLRVYLTVPRV